MEKRKPLRLRNYDYSSAGAYFITICAQNRRQIFSRIENSLPNNVGAGLAPPAIQYTEYGKIAKQQLENLPQRYPFLEIDRYVIMPDHIHIIFIIREDTGGASPAPTISDIICTYKSLTTRECNKIRKTGQIFQRSFFDRVIRNEKDYLEALEYIENNPIRWQTDELYTE